MKIQMVAKEFFSINFCYVERLFVGGGYLCLQVKAIIDSFYVCCEMFFPLTPMVACIFLFHSFMCVSSCTVCKSFVT